jgi:hypothetical protein
MFCRSVFNFSIWCLKSYIHGRLLASLIALSALTWWVCSLEGVAQHLLLLANWIKAESLNPFWPKLTFFKKKKIKKGLEWCGFVYRRFDPHGNFYIARDISNGGSEWVSKTKNWAWMGLNLKFLLCNNLLQLLFIFVKTHMLQTLDYCSVNVDWCPESIICGHR